MGPWYAAPPPAYAPPPTGYYGWVPPTHAFPDVPPRKCDSYDTVKSTNIRIMAVPRISFQS